MIIIGITGTNGAGKGAVVDFLKTQGFIHFSVKDYLIQKLEKKNLEPDRDNMRIVANEIRQKYGSDYIVRELYKKSSEQKSNSVIESIRTIGEAKFIQSQPNGFLFAVDAQPGLRYQRITDRKSSKDNVNFEEFIAQEKRETNPDDPNKQNLPGAIAMADYKFENNGTIRQLYAKVGKALNEIQIQKN